jgi:hypothetical protein
MGRLSLRDGAVTVAGKEGIKGYGILHIEVTGYLRTVSTSAD